MTSALVKRPFFDKELDLLGNLFGSRDRHMLESFFSNDAFLVDITDSENTITMKAELPGVKKEDISIDYNDGVLSITAEKKEEIEEKGERVLRKETRFGRMQRSFTVGNIEVENITAQHTDGILTISLKKKDADFKKIEIQ